jgi:hypothetical protein
MHGQRRPQVLVIAVFQPDAASEPGTPAEPDQLSQSRSDTQPMSEEFACVER